MTRLYFVSRSEARLFKFQQNIKCAQEFQLLTPMKEKLPGYMSYVCVTSEEQLSKPANLTYTELILFEENLHLYFLSNQLMRGVNLKPTLNLVVYAPRLQEIPECPRNTNQKRVLFTEKLHTKSDNR